MSWLAVIVCSMVRIIFDPNYEALIVCGLVGFSHLFVIRRLDPKVIAKYVLGDTFLLICFYFMLDNLWKNWLAVACNGFCCLALFLTSLPEIELKKEKI